METGIGFGNSGWIKAEATLVRYSSILWDADDDPDGNVQHIADHGLDVADVEWVLGAPTSEGTSDSSGLPAAW
ncbi:MAG TPA: hypothetical protein VET25_02965 [Aestuariivirgaceae bacterium]|nr:hypothetical protein [Aestuariivirgaceae bacterium]